MVQIDPQMTCTSTGRPAYAELRMGQGTAWMGSRHDGSLFVVVSDAVTDGSYSDEALDRMLAKGEIVRYGDVGEGLRRASEIGPDAAVELFVQGASYVEEAVTGEGPEAPAVSPLTVRFLGRPSPAQGPDFLSLGRLWAYVEYAKGNKPLDLSPGEVGRRLYDDIVAVEGPDGQVEDVPELRRAHA